MNTGIATRRTLDIYPTLGMITQIPAKELPLGASPDMMNMCVIGGALRKRPGYTQFPSGVSAFGDPVVGLASTQDEENNTLLYAFSEDEMFKYNPGSVVWDTCTGPAFTGGAGDLFVWEVSQNSLVASQGVDQVIRMPFTGTTYAILNANCPAAKYMTRAADRLIIAATQEGGVRKPFRIRRSVAADHTNWTGVGSGFTDLAEFPYHLKNLRKIGTRVAAYTEKAIWIGTRTGQASAPLDFQPVVTESGLYAPHTLKGRRSLHMYLGTDDVYEFNGMTVQGLSGPVQYEIFTTLNASVIQRMFGEVLNETQEYLLFLCTGSSSTPDRVWVYNWGRSVWYPWIVSGPQCSTLHRIDTTTTWDAIAVAWDSYGLEWDSISLQQAFPAMLTGHTDGKVYSWSLGNPTDAGVAIPCYWTSKDLSAEDLDQAFRGKQITLRGITVAYKSLGAAFEIDFYYMVDGGSWQGPYTKSINAMTAGDRTFTVDDQVSGGRIRFKIAHSDTSNTLIINSFHPEIELRDAQAR
jgi:hypothetical protein